jgi:hypothetical protein
MPFMLAATCLAVEQRHAPSLGQESLRGRQANTACGTGDEGDFGGVGHRQIL